MTIPVLALILSVISLTWQAFTWVQAGARLHVKYGWSIPVWLEEPVTYRSITVTNKGRSSTMVSSVTTVLPDKHHIPLPSDAFGRYALPYELRPGESISIHYQPDAIERVLASQGISPSTKIRPMACSGHGDVRGKWVPAVREA
ncbi:hypothetical protein [Luteococcus peritonei]|uniref:DUF3592 domain-containing protein n=1 Tax=Luteococcus peritonei TaxID=88874 RepID=A0ABW4RW93_9ACTN